jgi:superfamily I DNA/RNA helicase
MTRDWTPILLYMLNKTPIHVGKLILVIVREYEGEASAIVETIKAMVKSGLVIWDDQDVLRLTDAGLAEAQRDAPE